MRNVAVNMNDKYFQVSQLGEGDKVLLTDGSIVIFNRMKIKNFSGTINGALYNIPINMFKELLEKAIVKVNKEYRELKHGELFYIKQKDNAIIFKFEEIKNGRIIGLNPLNNCRTKIDISLYGGKVSNL